jgi:Na+/melibiose symporter-like transporter
MIQGPFVAVLMIIPFAIFSMYKIDRFRHQEIIDELENR